MNDEIKKLNEQAEIFSKDLMLLSEEIKKVIVGQDSVINKVIIALIANGHILLEGVPGLAKTLLIRTLAQSISADFCRLQFTPDLLPADIMGTKIYNAKTGLFITKKGPIFSNFILADEINRAPPKVQSALLEAMQEHQVTISGDTFKLDTPFLVMATQNPLETEGTYRLPEAQIDRFMFKILISYPSKDQEKEIIQRNTQGNEIKVKTILSTSKLLGIQKFNYLIYADKKIEDYVTSLVDITRNPNDYGLNVDNHIELGASPRASLWLILAAKANALLNGRGYVIPEDVQEIAPDVLRHRIVLSYDAEAEGIDADDIIEKILDKVKIP